MTSRAGRTRAHLLDTALRLFDERGYAQVRVEDIAREAGLSRAAFYKHFGERDEIIGELLDRLLAPTDPVSATVRGDAAAGAAGNHLDRAVTLLLRAAERMVAQESLARFVYSLPVRPTSEIGRARPAVFGGVAILAREAQEAGELRAGLDAEVVVAHLARTFEAAMRDWAEGRAADATAHLSTLLEMALHGVARP